MQLFRFGLLNLQHPIEDQEIHLGFNTAQEAKDWSKINNNLAIKYPLRSLYYYMGSL